MKKITILSGKGGVGKSSIASSLAVTLSKNHKIIAADCDVDASNLAILLGVKDFDEWNPISTNINPLFDLKKCSSCKKCMEACHFDAIEWKDNKPSLKRFGCEGCGVCKIICPENAVSMKSVDNAKIGYSDTKYGFKIVSAQLDIGESGSGKVVAEVKKMANIIEKESEYLIIDSAAGIGCQVIASVAGSNYVIAVTEPTPSGFEDLKRAINVVEHFGIKYGVIINKSDLNPDILLKIETYFKEKNIKIIAKLKYDKKFVESNVEMKPLVVYDKSYEKIFEEIAKEVI